MSHAVASRAEKPLRLGQQVRVGWVRELSEALTHVDSVVIAKIDRVPARDVNQLRRAMGGSFYVVKNSLCRLALRQKGWNDLEKLLQGTCGIGAIQGDAAAACKLLVQFSKEHEGFVLQGGVLTGQMLGVQDLQNLARLPAREVILSQLAGIVQSPLRRLAFALQGPIRSLAMTLAAVGQKKGKEKGEEGNVKS